jgi:murein DD-endopeptidase MepM/ murein hydrolase activator NlpD
VQLTISKGWRAALAQTVGLVLVFTPVAALAVAGGPGALVREDSGILAPVKRLMKKAAPKVAEPAMKIVWRGLDIDGDGAADFANPTGLAPRDHDTFGGGGFGASRDGGVRSHEGVDYAATAGQAVLSPISGFVTKIGYAYAGDDSLRFVEISNPALGYVARTFYVDPTVTVGQALRLGERIGTVVSLQDHYPGITDHVHLEISRGGLGRLNATDLILAHKVRIKPARG